MPELALGIAEALSTRWGLTLRESELSLGRKIQGEQSSSNIPVKWNSSSLTKMCLAVHPSTEWPQIVLF